MNETTQFLEVDEAGRVRTPREKQEAMLDEFERSGMTGMQFARHVGVKYPTLMNWVRRRMWEQGRELELLRLVGDKFLGAWVTPGHAERHRKSGEHIAVYPAKVSYPNFAAGSTCRHCPTNPASCERMWAAASAWIEKKFSS